MSDLPSNLPPRPAYSFRRSFDKEIFRLTRMMLGYLLLIVISIIVLIPFVYILCASLKSSGDYFSSLFLPPGRDQFLGVAWNQLTLDNYHRIFLEFDFGRNILNSLFLASVTSVAATLTTAMGGYALAHFEFAGRRFISTIVIGSMLIPAFLLIAPAYQLLYHIGLLNTFLGVILPAVAPAFGVYLFRQAAISGVPQELLDAARIDGCGEIRIFFTIVLPLLRPTLGAFLMIAFLSMWNNYLSPQVILQSPDHFPVAVLVAQLKGVYTTEYGMLMAGTILSVLPIMLLFLLLQKEFIAGLTQGAVKG